MVYEKLPEATQDFINYSTSQNLKIAIVVLIVTLSALYVFYWKRQEDKTPFWTVGLMRLFLSLVAYVNLFFTPLMPLYIFPEVSVWVLFQVYGGLYLVFAIITLVLIIADFYRIVPGALLKFSGIDIQDEKVNRALKKAFRMRRVE